MSLVLRNDCGPVARLTLHQPDRLNPLSRAMIGALHDALDIIADDPAIRVVILCGAGKAFSAGHDLREMQAMRDGPDRTAALSQLFDCCTALMLAIRDLPQPVIAQVQGLATAAGCQLVAACDMAVAADTARFGVNGVNIGLFCSTPMVALTRAIPRKAAFEMLTTGGFISADRAQALGLINRIATPEDLAAETDRLAAAVAAKMTAAVRIGKRAFHDQIERPIAEAYAMMSDVMVANMERDDTAEGVAAFLEKRAPNWG